MLAADSSGSNQLSNIENSVKVVLANVTAKFVVKLNHTHRTHSIEDMLILDRTYHQVLDILHVNEVVNFFIVRVCRRKMGVKKFFGHLRVTRARNRVAVANRLRSCCFLLQFFKVV